MTDAFSTPDTHAFDHPELSLLAENAEAGPSSAANGSAVAGLSVEEAFEVEDTVRRILDGRYKTIGLQFPDELLPSSVPVFRAIQSRIQQSGAQAYVLADSTYGSCCPDVLSCLHLPADFLVHYGHACLTPTDALPVHYVFPRQALDVDHALLGLKDASKEDLSGAAAGAEADRKGVIVVWDVAFDWKSAELVRAFSADTDLPISFATIQRPLALAATSAPAASEPAAGETSKGQDKAPSLRSIVPPAGLEMRDCVIWYIGEGGRGMTKLQMQHADAAIFAYSPSLLSAKPLSSSRYLQRRLLSIHHAVSSSIFGLVVHSVGLRSAQPLLAELRQLLRAKRKKSYTLTVGRLNPAKLANFETIECFVLVGCQEGGLVDSKDFLRPIITPWELILALQGPEHPWEPSKWTLDMSKVVQEAKAAQAMADRTETTGNADDDAAGDEDEDEGPVFSLVDGTYKSRKLFGSIRKNETALRGEGGGVGAAVDGIKDLTVRNKEFSLARLESAGSHYLSTRHFQGLEVRYGEDEPAQLEEGRSGIARGYTEEK